MIWIVSIVLAGALWRLWLDQSALRREVSDLVLKLSRLEARTVPDLPVSDAVPPPAEAPQVEEPVALAAPVVERPKPRPLAEPAVRTRPAATSPPVRRSEPAFDLGAVLAEKGLAWLGGGGLVLGGVFLVGYAAQQGLLTPLVRLVLAVALAGAMLLVSEILRRRPGPRSQPLASAVLAGAGASTLYATLWAAHALYGYIGAAVSAGLLLTVSALLLALSTRRREPLALMALLGAYAAPLLTRPQDWSEPSLLVHILAVAAAGLAVAWRRGWSAAALASATGALVLDILTLPHADGWRAAALPVLIMALTLAWRSRVFADTRPARLTVPVGIGLAALALFFPFGAIRDSETVAMAVVAAALLAALAALAARRDWVSPWLLAAPAALLVLGLGLDIQFGSKPVQALARAAAVLGSGVLALAGLYALPTPRRDGAALPTAAGALLLALLAGSGLPALPGAALVLVATLPAALATGWLGRHRPPPAGERRHDAWTLSATAGLLLAAHIAAPDWSRPAAFALVALAFAVLQNRLSWLGLGIAAMAAVGLATGAALSPQAIAAAYGSAAEAGRAVAAALTAALLAALAAWRLRPHPPIGAARQVLGAAPVGLALIGAFLGLRHLAAGERPALDLLTESALRTLLLAMGGASALLMLREVKGIIARAGPHVLLGAALASAALGQLLVFNPWWGVLPQSVDAVPVLNSLLLAYLAPAAVFGVASTRLYRAGALPPARIYGAAAATLALAWAILEIRRLFHAPDMTAGVVAFAETCLMGIAVCAAPLLMRRYAPAPARQDAGRAADGLALAAMPAALLLTGLVVNPWWGLVPVLPGPPWLTGPALAALAILAALNARRLIGAARETALVVAAAQALVLVTLSVRWAFHPGNMQTTTAVGLETWTYSALWALFGAALLALGSAIHERALRWMALGVLFLTAGKVLVFDMASLGGVARAASFLAVGALMVAAAVLARRLRRPPPA